VEKELGPGKLDLRARNYFILGTSLAMLFDITVASDFLRALTRLLEEWEYYCEKGGKTMVSLSLNGARTITDGDRKACSKAKRARTRVIPLKRNPTLSS
jgi:hypothetical protein